MICYWLQSLKDFCSLSFDDQVQYIVSLSHCFLLGIKFCSQQAYGNFTSLKIFCKCGVCTYIISRVHTTFYYELMVLMFVSALYKLIVHMYLCTVVRGYLPASEDIKDNLMGVDRVQEELQQLNQLKQVCITS